jgi:cytochrome c oxidase subunit 2
MAFTVRAVEASEFADWLEAQQQDPSKPLGAAARGRDVFLESGCGKCHTIDGTSEGREGPDLTHLASRLTLAGGTFPNTPDHLRQWVSRPQDLKEGVAMPNSELSDEDLEDLLAYLGSLE